MRKWIRGLVSTEERKLQEIAREQALAFEQRHVDRAAVPERPLSETIAAISSPDVRPVFSCEGHAFGLNEHEQRRHWFIGGATDTGKTTTVHEMLVSRIAASAARVVARGGDLDAASLDVEMFLLDPKDDGPALKRRFAALFLRSSRAIQRVLRGSFASIEMRRIPGGESEVTVKPLLVANDSVSPEFQAAQFVEVVALTAPGEWTDSLKFVLFQLARVVLRKRYPFDDVFLYVVLTDEPYRLSLIPGLPVDLGDFLGRLRETIAPQTIAALLRRIAMLLAFPEFRALLCLPPDASVRATGKVRRITIADCGTHSSIPSELRSALGHALITDDSLSIATRVVTIPKVQLIEEYVNLVLKSPALGARHIENLRTLRSAGVSVWFVAQSLDGLPGSDRAEILTNIGGMLTFQSRSAADILFPHLAPRPGDSRTETQRRSAFTREMETLPRQEAVLWLKTHPALRVRSIDAPDPTTATGIPADELLEIFDTELAPHTRVPLSVAAKMSAEWRAAHLPRSTQSSRTTKKPEASLRDLLGLGDES